MTLLRAKEQKLKETEGEKKERKTDKPRSSKIFKTISYLRRILVSADISLKATFPPSSENHRHKLYRRKMKRIKTDSP